MRGRTHVTPIRKLEISPMKAAVTIESSSSSTGVAERIEGPSVVAQPRVPSISKLQLCCAVYNWGLWAFLLALVMSQLFTIVSNSTISHPVNEYGQNVSAGPFAIPGENDEPYSDRSVVCIRRGKTMRALSLADALTSKTTVVEDTTGNAIHGYRVVNRSSVSLSEDRKRAWTRTCRLIDSTIEFLFSMCDSFGYNITRDNLRIAGDVYSKTLLRIPNSLPVLIIPLWDNSPLGRYVTPGWDGHACFFHLSGNYEDPSISRAYASGLNRSVRETLTVDWLRKPGGSWKNGWYDDLQGTRWHADMISTNQHDSSRMKARQFDAITQLELTCRNSSDCAEQTIISNWGSEFLSTRYLTGLQNVIISNGYRYGLFYVKMEGPNIVTCIYDLSAFLSNASVISLLIRWMLVMLTLHRGYYKGHNIWHTADIGSFANAYSFIVLPIAMLPRMKMILAAFYSVGCEFEGDQKALGDSWFIMYPSIVDIGFLSASLLNMVAKVFRRRVNSWTFGFTILTLSGIHWFRVSIAQSPLFKIGGRVTVLIGSEEFKQLTLLDLFDAKNAMRMNGNVTSLLLLKLMVILLGFFLPLIGFSDKMGLHSKQSRATTPCAIEKALAIRACHVGGIGQSSIYEHLGNTRVMLNSYELIRLGYIVVGNRYLMTWDNWFVLTTVERMRRVYMLWNHRIIVFRVTESIGTNGLRTYTISERPEYKTLTDPDLNSVQWWDIDARPIP